MSIPLSTLRSSVHYSHIPDEGPRFDQTREQGSRSLTPPQTGARQEHELWRPWSLKPLTLILFALICCAYIGAFEYALQTAGRHGGGIFGVPDWVFQVIPTIATVLLGMLWSVVQNDVVRLEPYYQLSKAGGATGQESLLVDYQRVFQPRIPFMAIRRRYVV